MARAAAGRRSQAENQADELVVATARQLAGRCKGLQRLVVADRKEQAAARQAKRQPAAATAPATQSVAAATLRPQWPGAALGEYVGVEAFAGTLHGDGGVLELQRRARSEFFGTLHVGATAVYCGSHASHEEAVRTVGEIGRWLDEVGSTTAANSTGDGAPPGSPGSHRPPVRGEVARVRPAPRVEPEAARELAGQANGLMLQCAKGWGPAMQSVAKAKLDPDWPGAAGGMGKVALVGRVVVEGVVVEAGQFVGTHYVGPTAMYCGAHGSLQQAKLAVSEMGRWLFEVGRAGLALRPPHHAHVAGLKLVKVRDPATGQLVIHKLTRPPAARCGPAGVYYPKLRRYEVAAGVNPLSAAGETKRVADLVRWVRLHSTAQPGHARSGAARAVEEEAAEQELVNELVSQSKGLQRLFQMGLATNDAKGAKEDPQAMVTQSVAAARLRPRWPGADQDGGAVQVNSAGQRADKAQSWIGAHHVGPTAVYCGAHADRAGAVRTIETVKGWLKAAAQD